MRDIAAVSARRERGWSGSNRRSGQRGRRAELVPFTIPPKPPSNLLCCSLSGLFPEPPFETCCGTQAADHFLCVFSNVSSLGYYVLPFSRYVAMDVAGGFTISIYHQLPVAA